MKGKAVFGIMLTLLLIGTLTLAFNIQQVKAEPKIIHVDASNIDDPLEDGTIDHPFDKIQEGVYAASSGDTVLVAAGIYHENIILKNLVQVLGAGADVTTIDGGVAENVVLAEWIVDPSTVFRGFTITNGQNGICVKRYSLITISNCIVTGNQEHGISVKNSNPTINNCVVRSNQVHGINCENSNPTITICTITDNGNRGIVIHSSNATITDCTVSRNVWFQIGVSAPTAYEHGRPKLGSSANVTNCVITNGEYGGVDLYFASINTTNCVIAGFERSGIGFGYGHATVINSILWANGDDLPSEDCTVTYSTIEEGYLGEGNICVYPMFVNPGEGDYHLQAGSPCIDAGTNEDAPGTDFEGNPRPTDGDGDGIAVVDMGAYEFFSSQYLTIHSSPIGLTFTVDGVFCTTPWSGAYIEDASVSLKMPDMHTVDNARYYWNQWGDGNTSRTRTVTMNTNITLSAYFTGPYHQLTVTSSPITGITFTIDGVLQTTQYAEWLPEGSYTLEMPQTHDGHVWSHWLEDEDTSRTKAVTLDTKTTLTAVFPEFIPTILSIKLSGEHDYFVWEPVRIRLTALVSDAETMVPVSGANVTIEIYDPEENLWISDNMTEILLGRGVYEWQSTETIRRLMRHHQLRKGVYLVHVQASYKEGPIATDIIEFHIDPPQEQPIELESILMWIMIGIIGTIASVWYIDHRRLSRKL